jgi:hypothetical protein
VTIQDKLSLIVMVCALAVSIYEFVDVHRAPEYRKMVRALKGILLLYFAGLYGYALWGPSNYWVQTGVTSRTGLIIIFFVMAIDAWTLRRSQDRKHHA